VLVALRQHTGLVAYPLAHHKPIPENITNVRRDAYAVYVRPVQFPTADYALRTPGYYTLPVLARQPVFHLTTPEKHDLKC
jgi:hypothetical protein